MEDSSTNPYIPQASDQLQAKVYKPQTSFARLTKTALLVSGGLIVLFGIALALLIPRSSAVDQKARADFANIVQPADKLSKAITIKSTLGFSVHYPDQLFTSYGEIGAARVSDNDDADKVNGQYYENSDLEQERKYGMVRITPIESIDTSRSAVALPPELEIRSYDKAALLITDEAKKATKDTSKTGSASDDTPSGELSLNTFVAIDSKKRKADRISTDDTIIPIEASKPTSTEINGTTYQKVRYTARNENYGITSESYDDCYYTIKDGQPYSACIVKVRPASISAAALLEDTLRQISYQSPQDIEETPEKVSYNPKINLALSFNLAEATNEKTEDQSVNESSDNSEDVPRTEQVVVVPEYVKDEKSLKAIAKNQPAVVRIGTLYCANLSLKMADGSTASTLSDACVGRIATGAFISNDGYIATTGHAVRFHPKDAINGYINFAQSRDEMFTRLQRVLDYMLKAGHIRESDADYLKTGAGTGDQNALAKIENLGSVIPNDFVQVSSDSYSYAIQPTNEPMVLNRSEGNKPSFAYSDAVLSAKFFKADYDASKAAQETFASPTSPKDVALLKVDGTFPTVKIGSGDDVKANQKLATIGYPAYANSGLTIDKILNIPVASNRTVEQTFKQEGSFLIQTNEPTLPGNDGAPTFDADNRMVGMAVYGHKYCPDQQCFGSGTVRSSNGLLAMIDKNNIELSANSDITDIWTSGVDAYFAGNYSAAASQFASAGEKYRFNQLAKGLTELSTSKFGSASDTSLINQIVSFSKGTIIFLAIAMAILGVLLLIHLKRLDMMQVGHYGSVAPSEPAVVAPQQFNQPMSYGPPVQSAMPTSPYVGQPPIQSAPVAPQPQPFVAQPSVQPQAFSSQYPPIQTPQSEAPDAQPVQQTPTTEPMLAIQHEPELTEDTSDSSENLEIKHNS